MSKISPLFVCVCVVPFLLWGCTSPDNPTAEPSDQIAIDDEQIVSIVAFGDSLTEGYGLENPDQDSYPAQLEKRLQADGYDVAIENAGISGETSTGARQRADWIAESMPDGVILFTGANDMLRGIDPEIVEHNILEIIEVFQNKNIPVLLIPMQAQTGLGKQYEQQFNTLYLGISNNKNIPISSFPLQHIAFVPSLNGEDGIHPNQKGYELFVQAIYSDVLNLIEMKK